ncbi:MULTISPECIES: alpha/beta hydrolase family protein [Spongiibacter]|jgi:pimeloyl-ACP methyl ester carboxylesterase|uniref:alpha/beta hydrolase family protein n=2 Tax=Spongiibacteraceae TaxID=1706375 RepID=UPI000C095619|nr:MULTISPECIES: alpha/beta hydrolase family protein [unclassified Spongiibacter]MAK45213.1 alpha/beta hydrolase [Spongiibacter sp.]|tara:strand:- start:9740 stop:10948 length:1209 start_codon:yes stop_codon:yes gene_type:complete
MTDNALPKVTEMPPWWLSLPEDFYSQSDGTELDGESPLQVYGTAAVDRVLRTALGSAISASLLPKLLLNPSALADERRFMDFYAGLAAQRDVTKVFKTPPQVDVKAVQTPRWAGWRKKVPTLQLSFDSPFEPLNPDMVDRYLSHQRNRRAQVQYWSHPEGPRPTLIFVHGVVASDYEFNSRFFSLPWFYERGYDIALFTIPFHGQRAGRLSLFSGQGLFSDGFAQMTEGMLQSICDLRVLVDFLERRGAPHIGISGLSLGGYLSALLAAVEPRLAFCIPNSPLVAPVDTIRSWQPTHEIMELIERRSGFSAMDLRRGMAIHSPLSYQPLLDPEKVMIIGGAGDRFTPPRFVRLLHGHWPDSHLHWFPGNHVIHLGRQEYLKLMLSFMDSHCQGQTLQQRAQA